jgi:uncharacterized membrane protein
MWRHVMFDLVFGLPLHVLVNHAVVVFVPLTAVAAVIFAVVPRWRWLLRWPVLVGAAACLVTGYVAKESGQDFFDRLGQPQVAVMHRDRAYVLFWILLAFFVVSLTATFLLGGRSPLPGSRQVRGASRPVQLVVALLLVAVAVGAGAQVVLTGDAGARAVWGGQ